MPHSKLMVPLQLALACALTAIFFVGCTEKPKGARDGGSTVTFAVKDAVTSTISKTTLNPKTDLPRGVFYDFKVCFNDEALNAPLVDQPLRVVSEIDGRVLANNERTDRAGCLKVMSEVEFEFFGSPRYIEYPLLISSSGRHRGEIRHRLALNPWAAFVRDSRFPTMVDLRFGKLPNTKRPLVPSEQSLKALTERNYRSDRPKLFLREVRTTSTEVGHTLAGTQVNIIVQAVPVIRYEDAGGEFLEYPIVRGRVRLQPQLFHFGPTKVPLKQSDVQSRSLNGRDLRLVALHNPVPAQEVTLSPARPLTYPFKVLIPNYNKVGEILVALDASYANFLPTTEEEEKEQLKYSQRDMSDKAKDLASCRARQWSPLKPFQFSGLFFLAPAQDFLRTIQAVAVADTVHGLIGGKLLPTRSKESSTSLLANVQSLIADATSPGKDDEDNSNKHYEEIETLRCQPYFDYEAFQYAAVTAKEVDELVDDDRVSEPYNPSVEGWQPTLFTVLRMQRPGNTGVERSIDRPELKHLRETVLERTINVQLTLCIRNYFSHRPLEGRELKITVDDVPIEDNQRPSTDTEGCFSWIYRHTHSKWEIQRFIFKFIRVQNAELGIDLEIPMALNPWDPGWTLGRDIRHVSACLKDAQLIRGRVSNGTDQVLECIRRKGLPEACKDSDGRIRTDREVVFTPYTNGGIGAACVPKSFISSDQGPKTARDLSPADLREFRPAINLKKVDFTFQGSGFTIGERTPSRDELLGLRHYRRYMVNLEAEETRHDDMILGKGDRPDKTDGIYFVRIVFQRNIDEQTPNVAKNQMDHQYTVASDNCRTNEVTGVYQDPRKDRGYITHFEGLVEKKGNDLKFPISLNFSQMFLLGSRNRVIVQLLPLDPKFERKIINENHRVFDDRSGIILIDPKLPIPSDAFPSQVTLGTPNYHGVWTIFGTGNDREAVDLQATCQSTKEIIAAQVDNQEWRTRNEERFGVAEPSDRVMADAAFAKLVNDYKLQEIRLSTPEGEKLIQKISDGMNAVNRPAIHRDHDDPLNRMRDISSNPIMGLPRINLNHFPAIGWMDWYNVVDYYQNLGQMSLHGTVEDYILKRHVMMRKLCMYWASGKVYEDLLGRPSPFYPNKNPALKWSFDALPGHTIGSNLADRNDVDADQVDICKDPDNVMQIDKRIRILQIAPEKTEYLGGTSENYQVNRNAQMQYRFSADTALNQNDQNSLRYFSMSFGSGIIQSINDLTLNLVPNTLRLVSSSFPDVNRTHSWTSGRTIVKGMANDQSMSFTKGTYLVVQKISFNIHVTAHDKCLVIRPSDRFFANKNWKKKPNGQDMSIEEKNEYKRLGLVVCLANDLRERKRPVGGQNKELVINEHYYYVVQHFTPGQLQDEKMDFNRPWLMLIRGMRDYIQWISQIESLSNREDLLKDPATRSTLKLLDAPYLNRLRGRADNRFPTYDGMYSVVEDPLYGLDELTFKSDPNWRILRGTESDGKDKQDCDKATMKMWDPKFVYGGAHELKSLPCAVRDSDTLRAREYGHPR